jgi:O-antigen/teichoic acid export membrane protein
MSLRRKAAATAMFAYVQFGVAIVSGIFLVPLTLHSLGARTWGVWLASGEVLAYAGMTDLGMLAVLPWMIAEAEGRRDRDAIGRLVAQGVWLGALVAAVYVGLSMALWHLLPTALFLGPADRAVVARPLVLTVLLIAATYPLSAYRALLTGTQDVTFNGLLTLAQNVLSAVLTAVLLLKGFGLYALVFSTAGPQLAAALVSAIRAARLAPDAVFRFALPEVRTLKFLFTNGIGVWLGNVGWHLVAASNGIVITYLGHPEWVAVYACTGKLSAMCMPLAWVLPDSGHVGLAQLYGENRSRGRVGEVIVLMQRLHLVIAGIVAVGLLSFNPAFVAWWVGPQMFGGLSLNAWLALGVVVHSFAHGLMTSAAITGNRPRIGALVLVNGALQAPLAIFLGHRFGLVGVPAAAMIGVALTSLPGSAVLMHHSIDVSARRLVFDPAAAWAVRGLPVLVAALLVGLGYASIGFWLSAAAATALCVVYLAQLRAFYAEGLPLDERWIAWLRRFHVLPPAAAAPEPALERVGATR